MLAGSVTNREVYTKRETSHLRNDSGIGKCPFALIHKNHDPKDVILCVRDPAYIVTSVSHGDYLGAYMFGWTEEESAAKKALQNHWTAMKPYLAPRRGRGAFIVRYEDLISHPDAIQSELGKAFGLEYKDKPWSNWPDGFEVADYWRAPLGEPRKLRSRQGFNPEAKQRVETIAKKYPDFDECRRFFGYIE